MRACRRQSLAGQTTSEASAAPSAVGTDRRFLSKEWHAQRVLVAAAAHPSGCWPLRARVVMPRYADSKPQQGPCVPLCGVTAHGAERVEIVFS